MKSCSCSILINTSMYTSAPSWFDEFFATYSMSSFVIPCRLAPGWKRPTLTRYNRSGNRHTLGTFNPWHDMSTAYTYKSVTLTLVLHVAWYIKQVSTRGSHCTGDQLLTLRCAQSRTNSSALVATVEQPVAKTVAHCRIWLLTAFHLHSMPTCIYLLQHLAAAVTTSYI